MPNHQRAQQKNKTTNPADKINSSNVIKKHHDQLEKNWIAQLSPVFIQLKPISDQATSQTEIANSLGANLDILKLYQLQAELINRENKLQNLIKEQYESINEIFLNLESFCYLALKDLNSLYDTENDLEKVYHIVNAKDCMEEAFKHCNKLLDFFKASAGLIPLTHHKINLKELIKIVIGKIRPTAQDKQLQLNFNIASDVPELIMSDRYRLDKILTHLITSAIKFTKKGSVFLTVNAFKKISPKKVEKTENQDINQNIDNEIILNFIIKYSGIEISQKTKAAIYEKFHPHNSLIPINKELGVKLTLVKQFIHELTGEIEVIGNEKGTTFFCNIPIKLPLLKDNVNNDFNIKE